MWAPNTISWFVNSIKSTYCISIYIYMEVSWKWGTPKSSIFIGFPIINHPATGVPSFQEILILYVHIHVYIYVYKHDKAITGTISTNLAICPTDQVPLAPRVPLLLLRSKRFNPKVSTWRATGRRGGEHRCPGVLWIFGNTKREIFWDLMVIL